MSRFLPLDARERTLSKDEFLALLETETAAALPAAARTAGSSAPEISP